MRELVAEDDDARTLEVPFVREQLLSLDPPALLGGECTVCGKLSFPVLRSCANCGAPDPTVAILPSEGTIYSFTIVHFAAPGYAGEVPYAVGIVELDSQIRVESTLVADDLDAIRIGMNVGFTLLRVPTETGPVLSYAYELTEAES